MTEREKKVRVKNKKEYKKLIWSIQLKDLIYV